MQTPERKPCRVFIMIAESISQKSAYPDRVINTLVKADPQPAAARCTIIKCGSRRAVEIP